MRWGRKNEKNIRDICNNGRNFSKLIANTKPQMKKVQRVLNIMNARFVQNNNKIYSNAYHHVYIYICNI